MEFVLDDWMDAVLGDTQLSGNVMLHYLSVYHDDVMNCGIGTLCGEVDRPPWMGVVF